MEEQFDVRIGEALKEHGIEVACEGKGHLLELGRMYARQAALKRPDRTATADDAAMGFFKAGLPANLLGCSAGALFKNEEWEFSGRWHNSIRISNHAHTIRVWKLKEGS